MSSRYTNDGGSYQRDSRTQLFGTPNSNFHAMTPQRVSSPYENDVNTARFDESYLLSLESQNDEDLDSMGQKVAMLKNLGVKMGTEINKSIKIGDDFTDSMDKGKVKLKNTWNRMIVMSQRAGITWRMWLTVFGVVTLWFFWVWLF